MQAKLEKLKKTELIALIGGMTAGIEKLTPTLARVREIIGVRSYEDMVRVLEEIQTDLGLSPWESIRDHHAHGCGRCEEKYDEGYDKGLDEGSAGMVEAEELEGADDEIAGLTRSNDELQDELEEIGGKYEDLQVEFKKLKTNHERLKKRRAQS